MDFTNQIGITNDQVYTNRRDINNLMELLGNFKQQLLQIEARLPPLGVTYVTNPMSTTLDGGGFTIYNVSGLTITGKSDLKGILNVGGNAAFSTDVNITGATTLNSTLSVGDDANVGGTLTVTDATTLSSTLQTDGATTLKDTLTVSGATTLSNTLSVSSDGTFSTNLNVHGSAIVTGSLSVSGAGTFSDSLTVSGATSLVGGLGVTGTSSLNGDVNVILSSVNITANQSSNNWEYQTLNITGGATLSHNLNVNGNAALTGTLTVSGATTLSNTLVVSGVIQATNTSSSTSTTSGALIVTGGVGIGNNVHIGGILNVTGATTLGSTLNVANLGTLSSLSVTNTATITGKTTMQADADINGNLDVTGTLNVTLGTILTNLNVTGNAVVTGTVSLGNTLTVSGATTLNNTLDVSDATSLGSTLNVTGNAEITGTVSLGNTLTVSGATSLSTLDVTGNAVVTGTSIVYGASTFDSTLNINGITIISSTEPSSNTSTGALRVVGGVGIGGDLHAKDIFTTGAAYVVGSFTVNGGTTLSGPLTVNNAANITTNLTVEGITKINSLQSASSINSGALQVLGGVGIQEKLWVGNDLNVSTTAVLNNLMVNNSTTLGGDSPSSQTTLLVKAVSTFNDDVNLVQTLTVGGIAQFNSDLQFSMSSLANNYVGYIYEQLLGDSLFLDGPAPSDYNQFNEKIQIRSVSSSSASMSLNCYDSSASPGNSARITFRKFPAESGNYGPVNDHPRIRANDNLGFIDWKANTSAATVNDTRLAWINTKAISTDNTNFGGQITFSTRSAGSGSFNNVLILQDNSSVQVGNATSENVKFFVYNDVSNFDTVKIIDTKTGTIGCTLDLLHHSGSPSSGDIVTILNFGGYNDESAEINYGIISCIAEDVTHNAERGSITFSTKNNGSNLPTEKMRITSGGNVGIGTNDPLGTLHVSAPNTTYTHWGTVLRGGTTNNNSHAGISLHSTGDALSGSIGSNYNIVDIATISQTNTNRSSGYMVIGNTTVANKTSSFNFRGIVKGSTTPVDLLLIDNDGKVGIGTGSPGVRLHVKSSSSAVVKYESGTTGVYNEYTSINGTIGYIGDGSQTVSGAPASAFGIQAAAGDFIVATGGNIEKFRLTSAGNVGIGTGTPSQKLEVNGMVRVGGMILRNSTNGGSIGFNRNPTDGAYVGNASLRRFQINGPDPIWGDFLQIQSYDSAGANVGNITIQDNDVTGVGSLTLGVGGGLNGLGPLNISTTATDITGVNDFGSLVIVAGNSGGNIFSDLVYYATTMGHTVLVGGSVSGSPAGRTYTVVGSKLKLAMASGTYSVSATTTQGTL